ncbi:uncharacterized protein LOC105663579 isoform X3 [Megachile rotundata]|uniref:uncharacterized protein LOC105663579 isoform X3 n=1 Tax=Megachile rotundata TaxID=143995 RepID=UPI003FD6369E
MRSDRSQETILSEAAHDSKGTDLTSVVPCHVIKATLNTVERKETNKNIRTMQAIRDNDDIEEIGRPPPAMVTHTVVVGDAAATAAPRGRNGRTATAPGVVAAATAPTGEWAAAATNDEQEATSKNVGDVVAGGRRQDCNRSNNNTTVARTGSGKWTITHKIFYNK